MLDAGQVINGKYKIARCLGEGGMGAVYEAVHTAIGRRVAIKVVRSSSAKRHPEALERFRREAALAGRIETQHIAQILDTGVDEQTGLPFIVMEYVVGKDLSRLIVELGTLPVELTMRIAAQALLGLSKAHNVHVIHRDIKPANMMLAVGDAGDVTIKLLDFGIAKIKDSPMEGAQSGLTRTGDLVGSLDYLSPEQAIGSKNIDHRTDLWSLGVVIYESLCGHTPFHHHDNPGRRLIAICQEYPPSIESLVEGIPERVAAIVARSMQIDPSQRYQSAFEMYEEISRELPNGRAIHTRMMQKPASRSATIPCANHSTAAAKLLVAVPDDVRLRDSESNDRLVQGLAVTLPDGNSKRETDAADRATAESPQAKSLIMDREALPPKGVLAHLDEVYAAAGRVRITGKSADKTPNLLSRLEEMYADTGRWEAVLDLYLEHAKSRPTINEKIDLYLRAAQLCEERLSSPNRAFDAYLLAFLIDVNDEGNANALAASADQTERWDEVNQACDDFLRKDVTSEAALSLLLRVAVWADARGQTERSGKMLKTAMESRPGDMLTLRRVAIAYLDMGHWQEAATWLGRALQLAGPSRLRAEIAYDLGRLAEQYAKDGQYARIYYTRAIQADPSFSEAQEALKSLAHH